MQVGFLYRLRLCWPAVVSDDGLPNRSTLLRVICRLESWSESALMSVASFSLQDVACRALLYQGASLVERIKSSRTATAVDDRALVAAIEGMQNRSPGRQRTTPRATSEGPGDRRYTPVSPSLPRQTPMAFRRGRAVESPAKHALTDVMSPPMSKQSRWSSMGPTPTPHGSNKFAFVGDTGAPSSASSSVAMSLNSRKAAAAARPSQIRLREARRAALFSILPSMRRVFERIDELVSDTDVDRISRLGLWTELETTVTVGEQGAWIRLASAPVPVKIAKTGPTSNTGSSWRPTVTTSFPIPPAQLQAITVDTAAPAPVGEPGVVEGAVRIACSFFTMVHRQNATRVVAAPDDSSSGSHTQWGSVLEPSPPVHMTDVSFDRFRSVLTCFKAVYTKRFHEIRSSADKLLHARKFLQVRGCAFLMAAGVLTFALLVSCPTEHHLISEQHERRHVRNGAADHAFERVREATAGRRVLTTHACRNRRCGSEQQASSVRGVVFVIPLRHGIPIVFTAFSPPGVTC